MNKWKKVGLTALSEDISVKLETLALTASSARTNVPRALFVIAWTIFISINGTCL